MWTVTRNVLLSIVCATLLVEITLRAGLGFVVGKEALLYGIVDRQNDQGVANHGNVIDDAFSKYYPGQVKTDTDIEGKPFELIINKHGYRGEDFAISKPVGTARIVTLGASSTFGYHARDNETYPYFLEMNLQAACPNTPVDVINLGIPHLDISQIIALYEADGVPLNADFVTYYEGINDSQGGAWRSAAAPSLKQNVKRIVREKILAAALLKQLMRQEATFTEEQLRATTQTTAERYALALNDLRDAVHKSGSRLIVATQLAKSDLFMDPKDISNVTYEQELALIEAQLQQDGSVLESERILVTHAELMKLTRQWSAEHEIPLVDVIDRFGDHREELVSWVHLSPRGNQLVAKAFSDELKYLVCPEQHSGSGSTIALEDRRYELEQNLDIEPQ